MEEAIQGHPQHDDQNRQPKVAQANGVEFVQLEPRDLDKPTDLKDLKPLSVLAQALDNQWLPCGLLPEAFKTGGISGNTDERLRSQVRSEYIRSLINGDRVIVNRAFVYNT